MLGKIRYKLNSLRERVGFIPYKSIRRTDLLMYDNIYPHPISGYRSEEFTFLLNTFQNSKIILNPTSYKLIGTPLQMHSEHVLSIEKKEPKLKGKLIFSKKYININSKIFYCLFFNNILANLSWLEKLRIPFVFTLYPGGTFQVNNESKNKKLKKIFQSPMFKKVIVNQLFTKLYLIDNNLCAESHIEYVFGCVVPQKSINKNISNKLVYSKNKQTFDVCFCAAKYMSRGVDKGYDVFIDFAHKISKKFDFINFHVVGGFDENDIEVGEIKDKITFHGYQDFDSLIEVFEKMDVLVSPNKPFVLHDGSFDGFPLGAAVEAALNGVVVLVTDYLKQNDAFIHNEELIIIEADALSIVDEVTYLINNPEKLNEISMNGKNKFSKLYSNEIQMNARLEVLNTAIANL